MSQFSSKRGHRRTRHQFMATLSATKLMATPRATVPSQVLLSPCDQSVTPVWPDFLCPTFCCSPLFNCSYSLCLLWPLYLLLLLLLLFLDRLLLWPLHSMLYCRSGRPKPIWSPAPSTYDQTGDSCLSGAVEVVYNVGPDPGVVHLRDTYRDVRRERPRSLYSSFPISSNVSSSVSSSDDFKRTSSFASFPPTGSPSVATYATSFAQHSTVQTKVPPMTAPKPQINSQSWATGSTYCSIPGPGQSSIPGSRPAPRRGRGLLKMPGSTIPICGSCGSPIRYCMHVLCQSRSFSNRRWLSLKRSVHSGAEQDLVSAPLHLCQQSVQPFARRDRFCRRAGKTVLRAMLWVLYGAHLFQVLPKDQRGKAVDRSEFDLWPLSPLRRTVWTRWSASGTRSASAAPIASGRSATARSTWKTVCPTVKKTGTSCSQPNASAAGSPSRPATDGLRHSIRTITPIVLCAPFATRISRARASTLKMAVRFANHTPDESPVKLPKRWLGWDDRTALGINHN